MMKLSETRQMFLTRLVCDVGLNEVVRPRHVFFVQDLENKQENNNVHTVCYRQKLT